MNLPPYVFPAVMLVFGYPTKQQLERQKPERVAMRHLVHENSYRRMDIKELETMFAYKAVNKPWKDWMKAFCDRKYNSEFSKEMTRSVRTYLEKFL